VFSLDSVITAVGMADDISIMVAAVVLSVAIMMFSASRSAIS
jgi:predicted tellurium resistance membrane protein TerC